MFKEIQRIEEVFLSMYCSPVFQDHGGVIVNITATLYYRGQVLQAHAGSAKAAIGEFWLTHWSLEDAYVILKL